MTLDSPTFGVFPALLNSARKAANRLKEEGLQECELEDNRGLFVAFEKDVPQDVPQEDIYFAFINKGMVFALFVRG